jgi:hypothetical protein
LSFVFHYYLCGLSPFVLCYYFLKCAILCLALMLFVVVCHLLPYIVATFCCGSLSFVH